MASTREKADKAGLSAESLQKIQNKYDPAAEKEAKEWITKLTNEPINDFLKDLKSGVILCNLANVISPGAIKNINKQKFPFKQMENLSFFLQAVRDYGVSEYLLVCFNLLFVCIFGI
jgi:hypothetical protein